VSQARHLKFHKQKLVRKSLTHSSALWIAVYHQLIELSHFLEGQRYKSSYLNTRIVMVPHPCLPGPPIHWGLSEPSGRTTIIGRPGRSLPSKFVWSSTFTLLESRLGRQHSQRIRQTSQFGWFAWFAKELNSELSYRPCKPCHRHLH
jgi:hypothetical protein